MMRMQRVLQVDTGEDRKDIGLDEGHQHLKRIDCRNRQNAQGRNQPDGGEGGEAKGGSPSVEPTTETVAPVDVIEAPDRPDVDNDVDELAAPVIVPISGQGSSSGVGVALVLVLGLGLVALVVGSGVALLRSRI